MWKSVPGALTVHTYNHNVYWTILGSLQWSQVGHDKWAFSYVLKLCELFYYLCIYVHEKDLSIVHVCVCIMYNVYFWVCRTTLNGISQESSTLLFTMELLNCPRFCCLSLPPQWWDYKSTAKCLVFFFFYFRFKHLNSCPLEHKHFIDWPIFPAPNFLHVSCVVYFIFISFGHHGNTGFIERVL